MDPMRQRLPASDDFLASEKGTQRKKWKGLLPVALIFPNRYGLGNSNLGFQLVYALVNSLPGFVCERFFYQDNQPPVSLESGRPLRDFPVILCSLSFEQDFFNLLALFSAGGIEPLAERRSANTCRYRPGQPLVIGGGVASFINPEPLAPFVDLFVVGEAEPILPQLMAHLAEHLSAEEPEALLRGVVREFSGCYVPRFYAMQYGEDGILTGIAADQETPPRVRRVVLEQPRVAGHSKLLSPEAEFANLFLTELGRGCSRGCRFCAAGFVYRPPRLWQAESILAALAERPKEIQRVGLLGMEMARGEDLARIAEYLLREGCTLSFSSLRADAISNELCGLLAQSRLKSAAIAPDGGSERLRRVINKGISEQDVLCAAEALARAGINHLKLYFMIGLPTETEDDLVELLHLTDKVRKTLLGVGRETGRMGNITLSVNSFVPKAWTPFQFHGFAPLTTLKNSIQFLRKGVTGMANTRLVVDQPGNAFYQAVLARGDRRVGMALYAMLQGRQNWRQTMQGCGIEPEAYAMRQRGREEIFPWEILDHGIDRRYLWAEYQKALEEKSTIACDTSQCRRCGVCHG
ncbi:MAG: radical SAM protein [Proteobacteria bacterium]|nr:radical SAM protein [Pseudomonadota bacterium]MBU1546192.1 radical SAM protein [Pseudomonadota bacterium]MBU2618282.1 radical SAM protein [Pseudomonadota bacterium]